MNESRRESPSGETEAGRLSAAAFFCVSSSRYFLGAVALVNSLRLLGHTEPVYVLDYGLSEAERELLAPECTLVATPGDTTRSCSRRWRRWPTRPR